MATREKTVVFAFDTDTTTITDATVYNLAQITVSIPEASPTFTSVFAEVGWQDAITATGGTVTEHRVGLRLGAAGYTTFTETDDIAHTGENMAGIVGPVDFTSHFTTNWTGTSMTCDVQVYFDRTTGTTQGTRNATCLLYVTYTYDDDVVTNPTQLSTVRIPLESLVTTLPTAAANFGTSQIPQLTSGGILPEASPTIVDWFIVIEGSEANNSVATDWTMSANIDGGTTFAFAIQECGLSTDRFCRWVYKPSAPDPTASHNMQLWATIARANHITATLHVTYSFDASSTTRTLRSLLVPVEIASPLGVNTSAEASRFTRELFIADPGTITLKQSAFRINFNTTAAIAGLSFRAGPQAYRAYTNASVTVAGMFSLQQRIDSGSAQGAGITLARGSNTLTIDGYATDTTDQATNVSGYVLLNYECDVGGAGIGQNTRTVLKLASAWNALLQDRVRFAFSFPIPEADYWVMASGFCMLTMASTSSNALTLDVEVLSGESKGAGYLDVYADAYQCDPERGFTMTWARGRDVFKRHPADPDPDRLDIETTRDLRFYSSTTTALGVIATVTSHAFTWTVAGTCTGLGGDGSGYTVNIHRDDTEELVLQLTTTTGGAFTGTWYDNTIAVYATAADGSNAGRSAAAVAA